MDFKKYKVGVKRDSYDHDHMVSNGLEKSIHVVIRADQLLKMLIAGRFDFFLMHEKMLISEAKANNLNVSQFEKACFAFKAVDYLAFNREASLDLVRKLRKSYWEFLIEGKIVLH